MPDDNDRFPGQPGVDLEAASIQRSLAAPRSAHAGFPPFGDELPQSTRAAGSS